MQSYRSALALAVMTAILPNFAAYAAGILPTPQPEIAGNPEQTQVAPATAPRDPSAATTVDRRRSALKPDAGAASRAEGLFYIAPTATLPSRADDFRLDPAASAAAHSSRAEDSLFRRPGGTAGATGLRLSPAPYAPKPGWEVSGRVGPLRFLSPLDGEGETRLRLGGRLPGQPRMPGMGLFNLGLHYNFE